MYQKTQEILNTIRKERIEKLKHLVSSSLCTSASLCLKEEEMLIYVGILEVYKEYQTLSEKLKQNPSSKKLQHDVYYAADQYNKKIAQYTDQKNLLLPVLPYYVTMVEAGLYE